MIVSILLCALAASAGDPPFSKPFLLGGHFANGPRIPMCADFDGDGFADLACAYTPGGGIIDISLSVRGEKLRAHVAPARAFGADVVACAAGELMDPKGADIVLLLADGTVKIAYGFDGASMKVTRPIATVRDPTVAAIVLIDGGILVARASGAWTMILNPSKPDIRETIGDKDFRAIVPGPQGSVALVDRDGLVKLGRRIRDRWSFEILAKGGDRLASGDFDGDGEIDLAASGRLFRSCDPARAVDVDIPESAIWLASDLTGDRRDDLVCCRKDGDILLLASGPDDADGLTAEEEKKLGSDPHDRDTDRDGLLDGWETKDGLSPVRKDVICYVQCMSDVDLRAAKKELKKVRDYFGTLPVRGGIGLHLRWLDPLDAKKHHGRPWWELGNENLPREMWGKAHYMIVSRGGGGQSAETGTMGGCGDQALAAVFTHEFGHQIGLGHTGGFAPPWCPLYPSIMNYDFNYRPGAGYSTGEFASFQLIETELKERVPFPLRKVSYLGDHPFRFRIKEDGNATLVDWNRNGVFDSGTVAADINTSYSTDGGERSVIGKTVFGPAFAVAGDEAWLYSIHPDGALECRKYLGDRTWAEPQSLGTVGATGDPAAVAFDKRVLCFVPTKEGVAVYEDDVQRRSTIPASAGLEVSALAYRDRLLVLLWASGNRTISVAEPHGETWTHPKPLPVTSDIAPGVAEDSEGLLLGISDGGQWQLVRLQEGPKGFEVTERRWVGGEKSGWRGNRRANLFVEKDHVHFVATGMVEGAEGRACFYDAMTIGDRSHDDGWLLKRYYDEWTATASPAAAAGYKGDLLLAFRWYGNVGDQPTDNNLIVAHRGLGIGPEPMGDFDDVGHIAEFGLAHSILWMAPK